MTIARKSVFAGVVVSLGALAACQSAGPGPGPAPTSVDGQWMSPDGATVSTFSGGTFSATSTSSGKKILEGSYVVSGATVQIIGTSPITQTSVNYNCSVASPKALNCSSSAGQSFTLVRKA
jgi:hypothetical protein